jgi:hypothetical protein
MPVASQGIQRIAGLALIFQIFPDFFVPRTRENSEEKYSIRASMSFGESSPNHCKH